MMVTEMRIAYLSVENHRFDWGKYLLHLNDVKFHLEHYIQYFSSSRRHIIISNVPVRVQHLILDRLDVGPSTHSHKGHLIRPFCRGRFFNVSCVIQREHLELERQRVGYLSVIANELSLLRQAYFVVNNIELKTKL